MTEEIPRRPPAREPAARTYPHALPVVPVRARGLTVEGADGRRYLDCLSGAGTLALGHNHPVVLEAIRKVLDSGAPLNVPDLTTPVEEAFVTELRRTLPSGLADRARVRFCGPAGTDAVTTACALVRAATGRTGILGFAGGEHGTGSRAQPLAALGLTGRPLSHPQDYRCLFGLGGPYGAELAARWTEAVLDGADTAVPCCRPSRAHGAPGASAVDAAPDTPWPPASFDTHALPEPPGFPAVPDLPGLSGAGPATAPAGMILEPVQGEAVIPVPDEWLRRMRQVTAARAVPLIVDESHTGVGRTGAFWAVEHSGVTPDVMILSKAIGGSLPLAVVVHRDDLLDSGEPAHHAGPFRGNQLAMAAGAATLAHVRHHRLAERADTLGSRILSQLRELTRNLTCVGEVRGRGLMIGVELVGPEVDAGPVAGEARCAPREGSGTAAGVPLPHSPAGGVTRSTTGPYPAGPARPPAPHLATAVQRECLRRGLIVGLGGGGRGGPSGGERSVVRLLPPLTISDEQAAAMLDRLADALAAVARDHSRDHIPRGRHRPDRPHRQSERQHESGEPAEQAR
ncbi:aminotransferase class III-fold pyridoxal phosphate-dependent enzyme [Streptomyces pharetrae]|uniref:aminotransferase class III-fold pyridoxal phosphate-dependent enzyme n=1 Tax=Streptomyces pharetrae TaxID=291370 RepID=UPI00335FB6DF